MLFPAIGVPFPGVHDEYRYLLMGEMFASGRLAFPQHRHLRAIRMGTRPVGIGLARASILLLLLTTGFNTYHLIRTPDHAYSFSWNEGTGTPGPAAIERQLDQIPGKHLIVVRYGPAYHPFGEYVFNHADIDRSRIVWARELDPQQNDKLFTYFKDRQIWLFEPDGNSQTLTPLHVNSSRPGAHSGG